MATIAVNQDRVAPVFANIAEIFPAIAGETINRGDPLFFDTTDGKVYKSLAATVATAAFAGYSLHKAGAGQAVDVLKRGHMYGLDVSAMAVGDQAFVADDGTSDTAAGTVSVATGSVVPLSDPALTQVLYVEADWLTGAYAAGA